MIEKIFMLAQGLAITTHVWIDPDILRLSRPQSNIFIEKLS